MRAFVEVCVDCGLRRLIVHVVDKKDGVID
jgi:hypothetical protein